MRRIGFLPLALAAVVAVGCDNNRRDRTAATTAGDPAAVGTAGEADRAKPGMGDKDFVHDAAIAGMAEVELGRMASEKGTSPDVKKFGKMMVDDHTAAGDRLKSIATQYTVEWPTGLDDKHRDLRDKLAKLSGSEFDREYMSAMADGHEDVANKLESRIDKTTISKWKSDSSDRVAGQKAKVDGKAVTVMPERSDNAITMAINQWAADTYPTVQAHLTSAKELNNGLSKRQRTTTR
jgi:putative membrane protein